MKRAVVYKSVTGFTKKYAEWIAADLEADLLQADKVEPEQLTGYDWIIFGGSLHAVGINGVGFITENIEKFDRTGLVVFAVGATPVRSETVQEIRERNFASEPLRRVHFFYFRGGFDYRKLGLKDRFLMQLLKLRIKLKPAVRRTADEHGMLAAYERPVDFSDRSKISGLVQLVRGNDKIDEK